METNDKHINMLVELSEDYYSLFCSMLIYNELTKAIIESFNIGQSNYKYCVEIGNQIGEYFTCLRNLDWEELLKTISIYDERVQKNIIERFETIYRISKKYDINCIDELLDIINDQWNHKHINHDIFKRNIILALTMYTKDPRLCNFMNKSFNRIYIDMVNDDILDPMQPIGNSDEVLYTMLPIGLEFHEANYKVFSHTIDWQVMKNGSNPLSYLATFIKEEGDYYYNIVTNALKKDCCVFDNVFRCNVFSKPEPWCRTTYDWLTRLNQDKLCLIKDYLIIPKVFNHQLELYQGHENSEGDANIDELKEYAQQKKLILENK